MKLTDIFQKSKRSWDAGACRCFCCIEERGEVAIYHGSASCECGNKRCPHASDHRFVCTMSNEPGQVGVLATPAPTREGSADV